MSDEPLEPLPNDLRELLGAARATPKAPGKARVRAKLQSTLPTPGGGGGGGSPGSGASRLLAMFGAGALVGGLAVYGAMKPAPPPQVPIQVASSATAPAAVTVSAPRIEHVSEPAPATPPSATASVAPAKDSLEAERILLDPARTALGRGDGASALDATQKHAARFPNGALTEEREAIAVQALVKLNRLDEAKVRGKRFLARYPNSVLTFAVEAALASTPRDREGIE